MKRLFILTEVPDEAVSAYYAKSLFETAGLAKERGFEFQPLLIRSCTTSLLFNQGLTFCVEGEADGVVFLHRDVSWQAEHLLSLCESDKDAVGMPVFKDGQWHFDPGEIPRIEFDDETDELKVRWTCTDALYISRRAAQVLYDSHPTILYKGMELRAIMQGSESFQSYFSEEELLAHRLREAGLSMWLNPTVPVIHVGRFTECPDFNEILDQMKPKS